MTVISDQDELEPVYQREDGDCTRACIATILGVPYEDVPAFLKAPAKGRFEALQQWALGRGVLVGIQVDPLPTNREWWLAGVLAESPDGERFMHAVVMHYDRLYFDPLPHDDPEHRRRLTDGQIRWGVTFEPLDAPMSAVAAADEFEQSAPDEFDQAGLNLTGLTARVGGTWAGAGDVDDFTIDTTNHWAQRTAVSDANANTGRYAVLGAGTDTNMLAQVDLLAEVPTSPVLRQGVLLRYVDVNNWLMVVREKPAAGANRLRIYKRVAGTVTQLADREASASSAGWRTVRAFVDARGNVSAWEFEQGGAAPGDGLTVSDSALATGGALDDGKFGIYDAATSGFAGTRNYDNFIALTGSPQQYALHADQSIEFRHDKTERENAAGTAWGRPPQPRGARFVIPQAGDEDLVSRVVVRARRNDIDELPDEHIADLLRVEVLARPRYLNAPR